MSEERKLTKKKSTTSSKKSIKPTAAKKKDKSISKKSSISGSKKASPNVSRNDSIADKNPETNALPQESEPHFPVYQEGQKQPNPIPERNCVHHGRPLRFYCEACEEPICEDCQFSGPHNTELHRISSLQEAFDARCGYLREGTYAALLEKRDRLLAQLDKLDYRIAEIKSVSGIIERDIKTEYSGILERLSSAEGVKYAVLQHDMAEIQKDIERIDSIFDSLDEYLQGESRGDFVGFLIKFRELHEYIEYAVTKQFKTKIEVYPNDLPRELTERRQILERAEKSESLLKLKDEIIWNLIQEKKKLTQVAEVDLDKAVQQEWNEWAKLIERYSEELLKYKLVCAFCGTPLDDLSVNTACPGKSTGTQYTIEEPPLEWREGRRHYFAKPIKEIGTKSFVSKIMEDPRALAAFNVVKDGGNERLEELRRRLNEVDREGSNQVTQNEFKAVVSKVYYIDEANVAHLAEVISSGIRKLVPYAQFLQHITGSSFYAEIPSIKPTSSLLRGGIHQRVKSESYRNNQRRNDKKM